MSIKIDTLPLPGATYTNSWGNPRSGGRTHEGIDIFQPLGTAIHSTTAGIITALGNNSLGGLRVGITDPFGNYHYYAHMSDTSDGLHVGDSVTPGEVIGFVGNTGNAKGTPYHLHYGIRSASGGWVNPFQFLKNLVAGKSGETVSQETVSQETVSQDSTEPGLLSSLKFALIGGVIFIITLAVLLSLGLGYGLKGGEAVG